MHAGMKGHMTPKFYGATVIGERGQVVIPAEARRDLGFEPSTKLLVFGSHEKGGIMITRADAFSDFMTKAMGMMSRFEQVLNAEIEPEAGEELKEKTKATDETQSKV